MSTETIPHPFRGRLRPRPICPPPSATLASKPTNSTRCSCCLKPIVRIDPETKRKVTAVAFLCALRNCTRLRCAACMMAYRAIYCGESCGDVEGRDGGVRDEVGSRKVVVRDTSEAADVVEKVEMSAEEVGKIEEEDCAGCDDISSDCHKDQTTMRAEGNWRGKEMEEFIEAIGQTGLVEWREVLDEFRQDIDMSLTQTNCTIVNERVVEAEGKEGQLKLAENGTWNEEKEVVMNIKAAAKLTGAAEDKWKDEMERDELKETEQAIGQRKAQQDGDELLMLVPAATDDMADELEEADEAVGMIKVKEVMKPRTKMGDTQSAKLQQLDPEFDDLEEAEEAVRVVKEKSELKVLLTKMHNPEQEGRHFSDALDQKDDEKVLDAKGKQEDGPATRVSTVPLEDSEVAPKLLVASAEKISSAERTKQTHNEDPENDEISETEEEMILDEELGVKPIDELPKSNEV